MKNHNLTVIATDGFPIEPVVVEAVVSSAGERFDVVLDAKEDLGSSNLQKTFKSINIFISKQLFVCRRNAGDCSWFDCLQSWTTGIC